MTPAVECRGVTKTYRSTDGRLVEALHPIDLAVAPGEFHVIIGPSGCGKSTLLWIMGGLTEASGGTVLVEGQPLTGPTPERVAMVFQGRCRPAPPTRTDKATPRPLRPTGQPRGRGGCVFGVPTWHTP